MDPVEERLAEVALRRERLAEVGDEAVDRRQRVRAEDDVLVAAE